MMAKIIGLTVFQDGLSPNFCCKFDRGFYLPTYRPLLFVARTSVYKTREGKGVSKIARGGV